MNKKGLSLIDIAVILVIIGVCVAFSVPRFREAKLRVEYRDKIENTFSTSQKIALQKEMEDKIKKVNPSRFATDMISYRLSDGTTVQCEYFQREKSGVELSNCADGKEYLAQINVVKINQ